MAGWIGLRASWWGVVWCKSVLSWYSGFSWNIDHMRAVWYKSPRVGIYLQCKLHAVDNSWEPRVVPPRIGGWVRGGWSVDGFGGIGEPKSWRDGGFKQDVCCRIRVL